MLYSKAIPAIWYAIPHSPILLFLKIKLTALLPVAKRRIGLLKSLGKPVEAISALTRFLDSSPTDAEAWAELSDLYASQGLYQQSMFALEEVLLITPNAWNVRHLIECQYEVIS